LLGFCKSVTSLERKFSILPSQATSATYRQFPPSKISFRKRPPSIPPYIQAVNRKQLAQLFARVSRRSPGRAADAIDGLVYRMLKDLKRPVIGPVARSTAAASTEAKPERP
jgi:hypothetical protein